MHSLDLITLLLIILSGINWLFMGLFGIDLFATIFGRDDVAFLRSAYILVGISALYQIIPLSKAISVTELVAEDLQRPGSN